MAPTLMIGAVVAGTQYLQAGSRSDPANTEPSRSSAALWEGKLQIHPDTDKDDPVYKRFAGDARAVNGDMGTGNSGRGR
jgi:Ca2+-transporting ATPase